MASPAELAPSSVQVGDPEVRSGTVLDNATAPFQAIRCTVPDESTLLATAHLGGWAPKTTPAGFFYPKKGDPVLIGFPRNGGAPMIVSWEPSASEPDAPLP